MKMEMTMTILFFLFLLALQLLKKGLRGPINYKNTKTRANSYIFQVLDCFQHPMFLTCK